METVSNETGEAAERLKLESRLEQLNIRSFKKKKNKWHKLIFYSFIIRRTSENQEKIRLLHQYNEIKDLCQTLIGCEAEAKGVCVAELYTKFGLEFKE